MNSQFQNVFSIKSRTHTKSTNPFIIRIPANSSSQQNIQLSISCHILKKLALIDISQNRQDADLFKQCLLDAIENPFLNLKCKQTIKELLYFLEYWQFRMGKAASWPNTRACFYYLQDKLKKNKLFQQLDMVRLKRAHLEPNKKDFLTQIMAENIYSQELKSYITYLKQNPDQQQQKDLKLDKMNDIDELKSSQQEKSQPFNTNSLKNILYCDRHSDWNQFAEAFRSLNSLKQNSTNFTTELQSQFISILQTYLLQKLPIFVNQMKVSNSPKEAIIRQLNFRKSIVQKIAPPSLVQILNMTISKIKYNKPL